MVSFGFLWLLMIWCSGFFSVFFGFCGCLGFFFLCWGGGGFGLLWALILGCCLIFFWFLSVWICSGGNKGCRVFFFFSWDMVAAFV